MIKKLSLLLALITFVRFSVYGDMRVVTDLSDFAWLVEEIGGDRVKVDSVVIPYMNPHFQEPKPSYIVKLNKADLMIEAGFELTQAWLYPLIEQARNADLLPGGKGHVLAGQGVRILDVPTQKLTRLEGDVHPMGNPHYNYDPRNILVIARNIRDGLIRLDPENSSLYQVRHEDFESAWKKALSRWQEQLKPYAGAKVVAYHNSLRYLFHCYSLDEVGYLEPKPGVPPSGKHLARLAAKMKSQDCRVIVYEPWDRRKAIQLLAEKTHSQMVKVSSGAGSWEEIQSLFDMWDYNVSSLVQSFQEADYGQQARAD